ncbi:MULTISPECIES: type I restriction endonuclease [Cyanophyceae]|uniref:type I restriction endonuclease n=1 Tax=Cyanophyceae TaxID=3028117 RepID=UPI00232DE766|nr:MULTISPECIES: type I restriction endonuclease [Cyanophyceae]MDB9354882.1 type I restriction endonuclease [Nodularia spumigena CS-587/03]MDB9340654.1 type I restriction endonuclease [Nodularia spumigena CS-589/07]MDB9359624.1 type I restriction endonuclease [Nodularia spumigena CS-588/02]MDB9363633.1 type I restriction endonuclease [Nodularia spumigena CS-588/02A10]MDB9401871.1 type I restriction endonuclease [Microcystis aeruginosa CS-567/02-A1]
MGFAEDITKLSKQIRKRIDNVFGEEATKMALIVPFLSALGYDVHDPSEVIPEYIADFAIKKAGQFEKVDYALAINGSIFMLVEAKAYGEKAEAHDGQLSRYFNGLLTTKIAIVTNGIDYRFFTDLRHKNVMDKEPFFIFNILDYQTKDIENLQFFHRNIFDVAAITHHAEEMIYVKAITQLIGNVLRSPSEGFVRFLVSELGTVAPGYEIPGRITAKVIEKFQPIIKKSIQGSLAELRTCSLNQEMAQSGESINFYQSDQPNIEAEELAAFAKIQTIIKKSKSYKFELQYRETANYFVINIGKVTWWFLRLYLSSTKKSFIARISIDEVKSLASGFLVQEVTATTGEAWSKITISSIDDLDRLARVIIRSYELEAAKH